MNILYNYWQITSSVSIAEYILFGYTEKCPQLLSDDARETFIEINAVELQFLLAMKIGLGASFEVVVTTKPSTNVSFFRVNYSIFGGINSKYGLN